MSKVEKFTERFNQLNIDNEDLLYGAETTLNGKILSGCLFITRNKVIYLARKDEIVFNKSNISFHLKGGMLLSTIEITDGSSKYKFTNIQKNDAKKLSDAFNNINTILTEKKEVETKEEITDTKEELKKEKSKKKYWMYGIIGFIVLLLIVPSSENAPVQKEIATPAVPVQKEVVTPTSPVKEVTQKKEKENDFTKESKYKTFTEVNRWLKENKKISLVDFSGKTTVFDAAFTEGYYKKVQIQFYGIIVNPLTNSMIEIDDYLDAIISINASLTGMSYSISKSNIMSAMSQFNKGTANEFKLGKTKIRLSRDSGNGLIEFTFYCEWAKN